MKQILLDRLQYYSEISPQKTVYALLNGQQPQSISFQQLQTEAQHFAYALIRKNISPGESALILLPQGLEYLIAFWGCLFAQVIAVPLYPPLRAKHIQRTTAVAEDAKASIVITNNDIAEMIENSNNPTLRALAIFNIDQDLSEKNSSVVLPQQKQQECFLQYTSGSTGAPKGVVVTHDRLENNLNMMKHAFVNDENSTTVSWLPLFHDMGLIANALGSVFNGFTLYLIDPIQFIRNPFCWLDAISKYRATQTLAPNFAYDLCVEEITEQQKQSLDLSCWKMALNGAEPVRYNTITKFTNKFASCGFRLSTFNPAYGMAELTLYASGKENIDDSPEVEIISIADTQKNLATLTDDVNDSQHMVSCGVPALGSQIRIVDPNTFSCLAVRTIGEIWIAGPHVCKGYWKKAELSQEIFEAYTSDGQGPFLRTGDLGYFNEKGSLFITGRLKNLIIIRGKNFVPGDIEFTIENHCKEIKKNFTICFSVDNEDQEHLIIVVEIRTNIDQAQLKKLTKEIRRIVLKIYNISPKEVVFVTRGGIPKTTSGKLQHQLCKRMYLENKLLLFQEVQSNEHSVVTL